MSWFMVDVESDGPIPGDWSMVCFGAIAIRPAMVNGGGDDSRTFYGKTAPISEKWKPEALAISGFTRGQHLAFPDPTVVMKEFLTWVDRMSVGRPMFISDNNGYDWSWINWYLWHFTDGNPFGHSSTNLGSLYKGMVRDMRKNFKHLRGTRHTHHPVDDCWGNVEALLKMREMLGLEINL